MHQNSENKEYAVSSDSVKFVHALSLPSACLWSHCVAKAAWIMSGSGCVKI